MRLIHKIKFAIKIIKVYKTWPKAFLDYFGFYHKNKLIHHRMRSSDEYLIRPRTSDFGIINEIFVIEEYNQLIDFIKKGSTVIDVGAQAGIFSVYAANKKKNVKVYSYEPFKENYPLLEKNVKINGLSNQIKVIKKGLSGKGGIKRFTICEENTGGHGFYAEGDQKIDIETISLDEVFASNKIKECDYLKMDCEGAEYEIFENASKKTLDKIKSISMEFHKNGDVNKLVKILNNAGFKTKVTDVGEGMLYAYKK